MRGGEESREYRCPEVGYIFIVGATKEKWSAQKSRERKESKGLRRKERTVKSHNRPSGYLVTFQVPLRLVCVFTTFTGRATLYQHSGPTNMVATQALLRIRDGGM